MIPTAHRECCICMAGDVHVGVQSNYRVMNYNI